MVNVGEWGCLQLRDGIIMKYWPGCAVVTQSQLGDVLPSINLKAGHGTSLLLFVNVPI